MVLLTTDEFEFILSRLSSPNDVELLHKRMNLPYDMLFNVLAKEITRFTTRNFYKVKAKAPVFVKRWHKEDSFYKIAKSENFPPILLAGFILENLGYSKKQVKMMIKDPDSVADKRIRKELKSAAKKDFVYSPSSSENQMKNGKRAEDGIGVWLDSKKIRYMTEYENRELEHHQRTPDFLLFEPIVINNRKVNWIESKASFGDKREIKRDYKKQLQDYTKHFGFGAVVYWYGYVTDHGYKDVLVLTRDDFK